MANVGYRTARQLRMDDVNVDLLMENNPPLGSDPASLDLSMKNSYPDWIRMYDKTKSSWKLDVIKIMREKQYDLIHAHVEMPIFSYLSHRSFVVRVLGSDIRELAFTNSIRGFLLRKAYAKAKVVLFAAPVDVLLLKKLKIQSGIFVPLMWDTSFFTPLTIEKREFADKFIVFHPANLDWKIKGNDILIKGFSKFVQNNPNALLIMIDRGVDSIQTHELVNSLGIGDKVLFLKGPLTAPELLRYYNMSSVVADQFIFSGVGGISCETFSCGKPLITSCPETTYENLHPEDPPAIHAADPLTISKKLEYLKDEKIRNEIGKKGRMWVTKYHSNVVISKKIKYIYESVLNDSKIEEIRAGVLKIC